MSQRVTILIVVIVALIAFALWTVSLRLEEAARLPDPTDEAPAAAETAPEIADSEDAPAAATVAIPARPQLADPDTAKPAPLDPTAAQGLYDDLRTAAASIGDISDAATIKKKPEFTLPEIERPKPAKDDDKDPETDPGA